MSTDTTRDTVEVAEASAVPAGLAVPGALPATPGLGRSNTLVNVVAPIVGFAVFLGLWYLMHSWALGAVFDKPSFLIPSPPTVVDKSFVASGPRAEMLRAVGWTALVAFLGLVVSITLGMLLAVLMAQATWVERSFWPYLISAQAIPILAVVPQIGNIFGFGLGSRVLVCVIISLFPIVSNTLFGLLSVEPSQHDLFTLKRAGRLTRLWKLQLPAALPTIFAGFRISAGLSVIGAVVGELFFQRGGNGIGILMAKYRARNLVPETYGALILSSLLGIAVFVIFGWMSKVAIGRWHESTRKSGG